MIKRLLCLLLALMLLAGCAQKPAAPEWQEDYDLGMRCLSEGNYEGAILAFSAVIEVEPRQIPAYTGRAEAYIKSGATGENYRSALADYETVLSIDDSIPAVWINTANLYEVLEGPEKAVQILTEAMEKTDGDDAVAQVLEEKQEAAEAQSAAGETVSRQEPSFADLPRDFLFSSGAGAWMTELVLEPDGSFTGSFHDSEAGDSGEGYPHGTVYVCDFSGRFSQPLRVDDCTWRCTLQELTVLTPPGATWYDNGQRFVAADPYGMDNAEEFYIYLPGKPRLELPEPCISWVSMQMDIEAAVPEGSYILYNAGGEQPFIHYAPIPESSTGSDDLSFTVTVHSTVDMLNVRSGPGEEYNITGQLAPNTTVTVTELMQKKGTTWGCTETGWIDLQYVDIHYDDAAVREIYAEDFLFQTTGEAFEKLGYRYVRCGYYQGSYLIRFVRYPFLIYACNCHHLAEGSQEIWGDEKIPVIYATGAAQLNPYLRADMTYAQLEAAVTQMPNLIYAESDNGYSDMDDTEILEFRIKTPSAFITYSWFLDWGNTPQQSALEVIIWLRSPVT